MNDENYKVVLDFLTTTNMSSDPDKWKDGYKVFKKETNSKLTFKEFDDILTSLLNYYYKISLNYNPDTKTYGKFIIRND